MKLATWKAEVVKRRDITQDLFCLWLKPEGEQKFAFKPGQYCTIGMYDSEGNVIRDSQDVPLVRPYSIVSAPHEDAIELFIELVPPPYGNLTPLLHKLVVGDTVALLPKAKGIFTFDPAYKNQVMVATVTGIAPFMSMIRDSIHWKKSGHHFYLLQGASYFDEFGYRDEFKDIMRTQAAGIDLVYIPTVSRPNEKRNEPWTRQRGRVNEILERYLEWWEISQLPGKILDTIVYACGHPEMIEDVKKRLAPRGWKVKEERYWK